MLLTVLTPTLNCASTLGAMLRSVVELEQQFPSKIQHLIGDGGSSDTTLAIIKHFASEHPFIECYALPGKNIPATLNNLVQLARGQYVLVLNGDDFIIPAAMASMLRRLIEKPLSGVLCSYVTIESGLGERLGERLANVAACDSYMSINHPGMLAHRQLFFDVGPYCERTPTAYDYVWTWSAYRKGVDFTVEPVVSAHVRLGGISQTRAHRAAMEILRYKINAGCFVKPLWNFSMFYLKQMLSHLFPSAILRQMKTIYRQRSHSVDRY